MGNSSAKLGAEIFAAQAESFLITEPNVFVKVKIVDLKKSTLVRRFIDLPKLFELLIGARIFSKD